jgi:hypothetical protein
MQYEAEITRVVVANIEAVRDDLDRACTELRGARGRVRDLEREVARLEALVDLAGERRTTEERAATSMR